MIPDISAIGPSRTLRKIRAKITSTIYLSYCINLKYKLSGKIALRILEPSSGGIGKRLNTASEILICAAIDKKRATYTMLPPRCRNL